MLRSLGFLSARILQSEDEYLGLSLFFPLQFEESRKNLLLRDFIIIIEKKMNPATIVELTAREGNQTAESLVRRRRRFRFYPNG